MTTHAPEAEHEDGDAPIPARSDLKDAIGWLLLGIAVLAGSIAMDRLERQNINPYTVPGLLPGLLGIAMILLGALLALRSISHGALREPLPPASALQRGERRRIWVVAALCMGYGVVLIGHGLPFWLASTIYVLASIVVVQRMSGDPEERRLDARAWVKAIAIALIASVVTQLVFQELFLVRMP